MNTLHLIKIGGVYRADPDFKDDNRWMFEHITGGRGWFSQSEYRRIVTLAWAHGWSTSEITKTSK